MDRGDGIVRWSMNPDRYEFLNVNTAGAGISLYRATGQAIPGCLDHVKVAKHLDYPPITTYDWSPTFGGLVSIGTKNGDVHLLRVDDNSDATITLPLKLQRSCQSVAFNTTGLLAVGLDRVRNDQCLQIWDLNQRLSGWDRSKAGFHLDPSSAESQPIIKLEPSVSVTSIRFFENNPQTLVAGIKNQRVTVYDIREPNGIVMSFTTRNNNNIAINHADPNYLASSNLESANVTIWDRRAGSSRMTASKRYSDVVDSGALPWGCVLSLNKTINSEKDTTIRSLRYCRDHRGLLGVLSSAGELQAVQTLREYADDEDQIEGSPELLYVQKSTTLEWPYFDPHAASSYNERIGSFDWMTFGSKEYQPRVLVRRNDASIDVKLVPMGVEKVLFESLEMSSNHSKINNVALPRFEDAKEAIDIYEPLASCLLGQDIDCAQKPAGLPQMQPGSATTGTPQADGITLNSAANSIYEKISWKHALLQQQIKQAQSDLSLAPEVVATDGEVTAETRLSSRDRHARFLERLTRREAERMVYGAQSTIMRARAVQGYLFDCTKNQMIVNEDVWLQDLWSWISGAQEAVDDQSMLSAKIDMSYMGVYSIWNNDIGLAPSSRLLDTQDNPDHHEWSSAIASINRKSEGKPFDGVDTNKPHHRRLCLTICGWGKTSEELDRDLEAFERSKLYTKAAVWALCEKEPKRAVEALQRGGSDYMFVALALELQGAGGAAIEKSRWDTLFQQHPQMVDDPYLRAIYALISTGDWKAIANEDSLPLRERVGIALRNFSDRELSSWLHIQMTQAIASGDIEGIILAGLTDKMMDIFAQYIINTGDIQTPVLAMSFACPAYFTDIRFNALRASYKRYLNNHRLHIKRAIFDAQSSKLAKLRDGPSLLKPPPRQVTLRCVHCNSSLSNDHRNSSSSPPVKIATEKAVAESRNALIDTNIHNGISCHNCGKHLPRCAVCLQTLGLPRSDQQRPNMSTSDWTDRKAELQKSFIMFCTKCPHAMHADHAKAWFERHTECPVSECRCQCYEGEARLRREREQRIAYEKALLDRGKQEVENGVASEAVKV